MGTIVTAEGLAPYLVCLTEGDPYRGRVIARGMGSVTATIDAPMRVFVTSRGYTPMELNLTPNMTRASVRPGTSHLNGPQSFEVSYGYPDTDAAHQRMASMLNSRSFIPPRAMVFARPSGDLTGTIALDQHTVNERARRYQRILLGLGFNVGPQGADGRWWTNSANAVQAWSRWYNALPEGPAPSPEDIANGVRLTRGPLVTVSRDLTAEKQTALDRFASRASDQLSDLQVQRTTIVNPPAPAQTSMLAVAGVVTGVVALVAFVAYANAKSNKRAAKA